MHDVEQAYEAFPNIGSWVLSGIRGIKDFMIPWSWPPTLLVFFRDATVQLDNLGSGGTQETSSGADDVCKSQSTDAKSSEGSQQNSLG